MNKPMFYVLSFTWGLPMTLAGALAGGVLRLLGIRPGRWGACWYFCVGRSWGGVSLGPVMIISEDSGRNIKDHEHGHAVQNCWFGPMMLFLVSIPSVVRYWYREYRKRIGKPCSTAYDAIWFEGQATILGVAYAQKWEKDYAELPKGE